MIGREVFTEKAYRALDLAQKIAGITVQETSGMIILQPVNTEHLVAALLGADAELFRKLLPARSGVVFDLSGVLEPYVPEQREYLLSIIEPVFSTSAEETVMRAVQESRRLGHSRVATEHLLIGLLEIPSPASRILREHGFYAEPIREQIAGGSITSQTTGVREGAILLGKTLQRAYAEIGLLPKPRT